MQRLQKRSADKLLQAWNKFENDPTIMSLEGCGIRNSDRIARSDTCGSLKEAIKQRKLDAQESKMSQAWGKFKNDPTIMSLHGCGIQNSDKIVKSEAYKSLKEAMKLRKLDAQERRKKMAGCSRQELRALGHSFDDHAYTSPVVPSPSTRWLKSTVVVPKSTEYSMEQFLYFLLCHMIYDSVERETWEIIMKDVAEELGIDKSYCTKVEMWMVGKRHCRFSDWRSDATDKIHFLVDQLPSFPQQILFVVLVVSACNHRSVYVSFFNIASTYSPDTTDLKTLKLQILSVISDRG